MLRNNNLNVIVTYVEDEPNIAQLLVSGLGLFGITVYPVFMSAEALLERIDAPEFEKADLFFFDIRLPRMTGLELAQELRRRGEKRPFVLVSAWPAPSEKELAAIQAEFLPKPFDFPDVIRTIQKLLGTPSG
jgi:CheY-like chemotaxis protein